MSRGTGQKDGPLLSKDFWSSERSRGERLIGWNCRLIKLKSCLRCSKVLKKRFFLAILTFLENLLVVTLVFGWTSLGASLCSGIKFLTLFLYLRFKSLLSELTVFFARSQQTVATSWSNWSKRCLRLVSSTRCSSALDVWVYSMSSCKIFLDACCKRNSHRVRSCSLPVPKAKLNFNFRPFGIELSCWQRKRKRWWL